MVFPLVAQDESLAELVALLPVLGADECFVATGSVRVWSLAGHCRAPALSILGDARSAWTHNLVTLGLLHITATRSDFLSRLLSREAQTSDLDSLPFRQDQGDVRMLRDSAHHIGRAVAEHLQRGLFAPERAGIVALLLRFSADGLALGKKRCFEDDLRLHTASGHATHFLANDTIFAHVRELVRGGGAALHFRSTDDTEALSEHLEKNNRRVGLLDLGGEPPSSAWQRPPRSTTAKLAGRDGWLGLEQALHSAPPPVSTRLSAWPNGVDWDARCEAALALPDAASSEATTLSSALGLW